MNHLRQNNEIYQRFVLSYLIDKPKLLDSVNDSLFSDENKELLSVIKGCAKRIGDSSPIPISVIMSMVSEGGFNKLTNFYVESFMDWKNRSVKESPHAVPPEFSFALARLNETRRRNSIYQSIEEAVSMLDQGMDKEALMHLKTIQAPSTTDSLMPTLWHMMESINDTHGFSTGIEAIDNHMGGLHRGNLMTIAGDTGSMKTMISLWLTIKVLEANPHFKAVYFEKEMPIKDIARRLVSYSLSISGEDILNSNEEARNAIKSKIRDIKNNNHLDSILSRLYIVPPTDFDTVADMFEIIENYKPDIWVLDFITQIGVDNNKNGSDFNFSIMQASNQLKKLVQVTDSFGILLSQIKKGLSQRPDKRIQQDDIEWSGAIKHLSAYILTTFYPSLYYSDAIVNKDTYFLVSVKNRFNKNFVLPLRCMPEFAQFYPPESNDLFLMKKWYKEYSNNFELK